MTDELQLQVAIAEYTGGVIQPGDNEDDFKKKLAGYINELIISDFNRLVYILYRLDINEKKIRQFLQAEPKADAGNLIAGLVIERQLQKMQLRKQYRQRDTNIAEDEKW
jgi:hypothetical protein